MLMAHYGFLVLLVAAQILSSSGAVVQANLRNKANLHTESSLATIESILLNNTMTQQIRAEIVMELADEAPKNKLLWVIFAMMFGCCGCDRCYMGQIALGCVKGFTLGGFLIWMWLDYFVAAANALTQEKKITILGYNNTFTENSIQPAFYAAVCLLLLQVWNMYNQHQAVQQNMKMQRELLSKMDEQAEASKTDEEAEAAPKRNIPMRQQSFAIMPTMMARNLRQAGLIEEKPTVPELIGAFKKIDKDGDGQLDREEVKEALAAMGASEDDVDEMIKNADTDGDGKISMDEFLKSAMPASA